MLHRTQMDAHGSNVNAMPDVGHSRGSADQVIQPAITGAELGTPGCQIAFALRASRACGPDA